MIIGSEDGRRKIHGGGRSVMRIFEDACRERERMSNEHRAARLVGRRDQFVMTPDGRCQRLQDDRQSLAACHRSGFLA